ncbi:FAD-dependent oxidoreductase [Amycolatopsis pigmentata]|uniref:FAD-dependent oxidoreductase n=1 Tax=Amycolatopsis pigmentata TaxID=450801 RepID=A0ABW5FJ58_9PSEU
MHIVVVGAGVIGVTTAYCLLARGHDVTLVDAADRVASGASSVNAGLLCPADSTVWATPQAPGMLLRALRDRETGFIRIKPAAFPELIPWGVRFLSQCSPRRMRRNMRFAYALSDYSRRELTRLGGEVPLDFGRNEDGLFVLYPSESALEQGWRDRAALAEVGVEYRRVGRDGLATVPGFTRAAAADVAGAIYASNSGYGDCQAFTRALTARILNLGVELRLSCPVRRVHVRKGQAGGVDTASGRITADTVLLAAGSMSATLAATARVRVPVVPAKGYGVTVPILDDEAIPMVGCIDERHHVAVTRMGPHVRMSSHAEFTGQNHDWAPENFAAIHGFADAMFGPEALDWPKANYGAGLRPLTPDGRPLIGPTALPGLWLNTGHGHLGWTQACGSASLIADLLDKRPTAIDARPYLPRRRHDACGSLSVSNPEEGAGWHVSS